MIEKKRGLGRGLDALLGSMVSPLPTDTTASARAVQCLPIERIRRGRHQPRRQFDAERLEELAASIAAHGVLQPIVVRPLADSDEYELIAGERRWRAAQQVGLSEIPAIVRHLDERAALVLALIENLQRDDLHPLEEAGGMQRLHLEFGLTHQQIAEAVGKSRTAVTNLLRLLELENTTKELFEQRQLEMGHARALLALKGAQQNAVAREVVARGLSVRETEQWVRRLLATEQTTAATKRGVPNALQTVPDPDVRRLEADLTARLGAQVAIEHRASGAGRVIIAYHSLDELDGILARIR